MQTKDNAVIIGLLVKISTGQVPDNMNDTVFAKIIRKEIPATIIYEDAESIAFLDIMPLSKGHTLLVPKEWFERIQDVPDELLASMFLKAKKLIIAMLHELHCDRIQLIVDGDRVPHFHIHLIPRFKDDQLHGPQTTISYSEGEMEQVALKIKNSL